MTETVTDRLHIRGFADPYFDQNCLVVQRRDTKAVIVLDPGLQFEAIVDLIEKEDLKVDHILLTHGHIDHVFGVPKVRELTGAPTYMHPLDREQFERNPKVMRQFGLDPDQFGQPVVDHDLEEGMAVGWQDLAFDVIHTPGHTRGSVCFLLGDRLLGGDTLFRRGVGRTDLPGGSTDALLASIQDKLYLLPPETIVYPGHGPITTIGEEMRE
ncbi:MAG TPA: MBL fold metallo-hydrolase, partial [Candidatus Dormibacteraeota bacterium]|nr:MBL fold metallo-hydrolase [Candidatus Dormibacteraeota bacterium]